MKNFISASLIVFFLVGKMAIALAQETAQDRVQCGDAAIRCGDVLGPGGMYILNDDLNCDVSPALIVIDGAHLNLNGHSLTCGAGLSPIGIQMNGEKASITNGYIFDCDRGVVLEGDGQHSVSRMEYTHSSPGTHMAFVVRSDKNRLFRNSAAGCDGCYEISGDGNWLLKNFVYDGPGNGFWLSPSAENNHLFHNVAVNQYAGGFFIEGDKNNLIMNEAVGTLWGVGFGIRGSENLFWHNKAIDNDGYGFNVDSTSTNNRILGNIAEDNKNTGISVSGTDNIIARNKAFGNGDGINSFDLYDDNLDCDNNIWRKNKLDTSNADCIK